MLVRAVLVTLAVMLVGWLVAGLRAAGAESEGAAIVEGAESKTASDEVARGLDRLRDAQSLNADKDPEIDEVILLSVTGSTGKSLALARKVVAEEPGNVDTWFALWAASLAADDRRRADLALARVRSLDPLRARVLERLDPQAQAGF